MRRLALSTLALLALAACGNRESDSAAVVDSAAAPNTANGALTNAGPVGDSLSSAAAGATVDSGAARAGGITGADTARTGVPATGPGTTGSGTPPRP